MLSHVAICPHAQFFKVSELCVSFLISQSKEYFSCKDVAICVIKSWDRRTFHTKQQDCVSLHGAQPLTCSLIGFQTCLGEWFSVTEPQT